MKNVPAHLAAPAAGFVGAEQAMEDLITTLQGILERLASGSPEHFVHELKHAIEITKAVHVLRHKSMLASHTLMTALIAELLATKQ